MDTNQSTQLTPPLSWDALPPALLICGNRDATATHALHILVTLFCANGGCHTCVTCKTIRNNQHHAITRVSPERQYSLDDLAIIRQTISFALDPQEHHVFILEQADLLTAACANSLLKSIEEPPRGYHFILLAEHPELLLPTIRSRCVITTLRDSSSSSKHHELFSFFVRTGQTDHLQFLRTLESSGIQERDSVDLIEALIIEWAHQLKEALSRDDFVHAQEASHAIKILQEALARPPMPGSSKLLWKNLFMQFHL